MTVLLVLAVIPLTVAIILARGEPVRTISCLCAMSVGCVIACTGVIGLLRNHRA